jgi:hypothetical protein
MNPRALADLEAYDATFLLPHVEAGYPEHLIVTVISNAGDR